MPDRAPSAIESARQQYVRARAERKERRSDAIVRFGVVPVAILLALAFSLSVLGPAWAAKPGHGTRGTFTAVECVKQKGECSWSGSFISNTGTDQKADTSLASGASIAYTGQQVPAIDTGSATEVFPVGGGRDWLYSSLATVFLVLCLIFWTMKVPVAAIRKRRRIATIGWPSA